MPHDIMTDSTAASLTNTSATATVHATGSVVNRVSIRDSDDDADYEVAFDSINFDMNSDFGGNVNAGAKRGTYGMSSLADVKMIPDRSDGCCVEFWSALKKILNFKNFIRNWPRTASIIHRTSLIFSLLVITLLFGYFLSKFEGPAEEIRNDSYLRYTWMQRTFPVESTVEAIRVLPMTCLQEYLNDPSKTFGNGTNLTYIISPLSHPNITANDLYSYIEKNYPYRSREFFTDPMPIYNLTIRTDSDNNITTDSIGNFSLSPTAISDLQNFMSKCEGVVGKVLQTVLSFTMETSTNNFKNDNAGLTFDWIRCSNAEDITGSYDNNTIDFRRFNRKRTRAAKYSLQASEFTKDWDADQKSLYDKYVLELGCHDYVNEMDDDFSSKYDDRDQQSDCYFNATNLSVNKATGRKKCELNVGASSWFWFTIMTTIGYGNFSPSTTGGYALVGCFGWLSIIAFGGVMISTTFTYTLIADDIFRRYSFRYLSSPLFSTLFWMFLSLSWMSLVAYNARNFWDYKVPDFEYTTANSYWFAYITMLTAGLGDFTLHPQGIFILDFFVWALLVLYGCIFLTAFLKKVGDIVKDIVPWPSSDKLVYYLARTSMFDSNQQTPISTSLESLKGMVGDLELRGREAFSGDTYRKFFRTSFYGNAEALAPDGKTIQYHRIKIQMEKEKLLIRLLVNTQSELDAHNTEFYDEMFLSDFTQNSDANNGSDNDGRFSSWRASIRKRSSNWEPNLAQTLEDMTRMEQVLESSLARTKRCRTRLLGISSVGGVANNHRSMVTIEEE